MADLEQFFAALRIEWGERDPATADFPNDRRFSTIVEETKGMATENKLALLNAAVSAMGENEVYVEIGTYRGTSLIGAALGHDSKQCVGIDNFVQFDGPIDECRANLDRFTSGNATLINDDAWRVLEAPPFSNVGVYFYDGRHTFGDQWRGFEAMEPHLSDKALVIVDDTSYRPVSAANSAYTAGNARYELLLEYDSPFNGDPRWWDGVQVYLFDRAKPVPNRRSSWRRLAGEVRWGPIYEGWRSVKRSQGVRKLRRLPRRLRRKLLSS